MPKATSREWLMATRLAARIKAEPDRAVQLIARVLSRHREACVAWALAERDGREAVTDDVYNEFASAVGVPVEMLKGAAE